MFGKIKFYLRTHFNKLHNIWKSIGYCKKNIRYYSRLRFKNIKNKNVLFFVVDPNLKHPGLADRFKAIIGCYYIAVKNNYNFKIIYKTPFPLENFITENKVKWIADFKDLEYSIGYTKFLTYRGAMELPRLKANKQYHCYNYNGSNLLKNITSNCDVLWSKLYNDLFKPTDRLQSALNKVNIKPKTYIAIHLRFVNALESFEIGHYNNLDDEKKTNLINRCKNKIREIIKNTSMPVLVFSDSKIFLNAIKDMNVIILNPNDIGHVSFSNDDSNFLKTFIDFYMISNASIVYRVIAPEMYSSTCFSKYAAIAGNAKFIDLHI